jgi:hypothetical protein
MWFIFLDTPCKWRDKYHQDMWVKRHVLLFTIYRFGIVQYSTNNVELYLRDCIRLEIKAKEAEHGQYII